MIFDLITIFLIFALVVFGIYTARRLGRFPKRTPDDVTPFLRPAEAHEYESLLDPGNEATLRLRLPRPEFAAWQRKRIHLMREYLSRMSHNSLILIEWGNMEAFLQENEVQRCCEKQVLAQELVQAATEFRLYSMLALAKLKLWLVLPPRFWFLIPSPSLPALRNVFGIDALSSYQRVKSAASGLSLIYSNDFHTQLVGRL